MQFYLDIAYFSFYVYTYFVSDTLHSNKIHLVQQEVIFQGVTKKVKKQTKKED